MSNWTFDFSNPASTGTLTVGDLFRAWGELELYKRAADIEADAQAKANAANYQVALANSMAAQGYSPPSAITPMVVLGGASILALLVLFGANRGT